MAQQTDATRFAELGEEHRTAADRIFHSAIFRRAPRLRDMLHYILECTLNGRIDELTEMRIAEKVFGRPEYNPSEENLVRVSARQLRTKIAEYYETEGREDSIQVDVPKGGYCATFRSRTEPDHPPEPLAALPIVSATTVPRRAANWPAIILGTLCAGLIALSVQLWKDSRQLKMASIVPRTTLFDPLVGNPGQRTDIVVTDSAIVLLDKLLHRYISVDDYASDRYLQNVPNILAREDQGEFFNLLRTRQISSLADMRIIATLFQTYPQDARSFSLRHARNMHARDFSNGDNFFVIGSSRSNPWSALFEDSVNFRTSERYGSSCFENTKPLPGEPNLYCSENQTSEQGTDYARIVLKHNASRTARVLLVAGIDMEATEAAGEFFLNPQSVPAALHALHASRLEELPDYELLLKSYSIGGTGRAAQIVSARRL